MITKGLVSFFFIVITLYNIFKQPPHVLTCERITAFELFYKLKYRETNNWLIISMHYINIFITVTLYKKTVDSINMKIF